MGKHYSAMQVRNNQADKYAKKLLSGRGLSREDMEKLCEDAYQHGRENGYYDAMNMGVKMVYAAAACAMHDIEGYGIDETEKMLRAIDNYFIGFIDWKEAFEKAKELTGADIIMRDQFDEMERMD